MIELLNICFIQSLQARLTSFSIKISNFTVVSVFFF